MQEKIFNALKTKYTNLGLSDKVLQGVASTLSATTTDETLENVVNSSEMMLKTFQSDFDTMRGENSNLKRKLQEAENQTAKPTDKQDGANEKKDDVKSLIEAQNKQLADMQKVITDFQAKEKTTQILGAIKSKLESEKIPQSFYGASLQGRSFESEEQIDEFVNTIKGSYTEFQDAMVKEGVMKAHTPAQGSQNPSEVSAWVKNFQNGAPNLQGKPIEVITSK